MKKKVAVLLVYLEHRMNSRRAIIVVLAALASASSLAAETGAES
jgi:hypothetical protein